MQDLKMTKTTCAVTVEFRTYKYLCIYYNKAEANCSKINHESDLIRKLEYPFVDPIKSTLIIARQRYDPVSSEATTER